jgi:hypothetical protein
MSAFDESAAAPAPAGDSVSGSTPNTNGPTIKDQAVNGNVSIIAISCNSRRQ